ncbi:hypothetical protein [Lysinibacillus fusiformis]|uniref:hypothetical protein n=1 Tax=Lysinibacillus fusiformis TaxID=28031 RepID=UPI0023A9D188|nr:hypothetical protein [Lysinibacillus fusiformis]WEA41630.1 hypothetical protein PWJ66_23110 [Lysinibacillus fusiformis]
MIKISTGSTKTAEEFIYDNINKLGEIKSIQHKRNGKSADFQTIISGEYYEMIIDGGITSGYSGTGPNGFIRVLKKLGLDEETAENLVKGNRDEEHSFIYNF